MLSPNTSVDQTLKHNQSLYTHQGDITDIVLSKFSVTNSALTECTVRLTSSIVSPIPHASRPIAINRLDRLTSGLMILPLNADLARALTREFMNGSVRKEYVARCKGKFPECVLSVDLDISIMC